MTQCWESPETTNINRLPVMPYLPGDAVSLDGVWRFQLLDGPDAAAAEGWRDMPVPSLWTMQDTGDLPQYTNVQMPFDELPPSTPARNPTGVYEREFRLPAGFAERRTVLRVGGFESLLRVWVNNVFVGMAKDGRLAADFDITEQLRDGSNTLSLRISKWSDATFIEDQDQWWHGGLSRSLHLFSTPRTHVAQLQVTPTLERGAGVLRVNAVLAFEAGIAEHGREIRVRVVGEEREQASGCSDGIPYAPATDEERAQAFAWFTSEYADAGIPADVQALLPQFEPRTAGSCAVELRVPWVRAWSAEQPHLYEVVVEHVDAEGRVLESFPQRVGFRSVEVRGRELLVNEAPVLLYGVNRHDFHRATGRVLTRDDIRADLLELKRWNVNAIRTSHYPNDPALLELADELGFYVVAEANIESHAHMHSICDDPRYLGAFVDRVSRMAQRDLHHASVILWSLGNESGYGANHDAAASWLRRFDATRPLHYEGAIRGDWSRGHHASDVICPMYPSIAAIVRHATSGRQDRPLIMCEYSHAMGNSNGTLREYWDAIEQHEGLQGGFLWEMWDHGLDQRLPDGSLRAAYGGDFGEARHDGNFCCDGVFFPDRTAKPAMREFQQIAAPLRLERLREDEFLLRNLQWFVDASDFVLVWEAVHADGSVTTGRLADLRVAPRGVTTMILPTAGVALLTVSIRRRTDTAWSEAGAEVGWAQFALQDAGVAANLAWAGLASQDELAFGRDLVDAAEISLWRAPTDNDRIGSTALRWEEWGLRDLRCLERHEQALPGATVVTRVLETGVGVQLRHRRHIAVEGQSFVVTEQLELPDALQDLARVGTCLDLPVCERVTWFGRGAHETYPDRKLARLGLWSASMRDLHTDYVRPQENGGREDVHWMLVEGAEGAWRIVNDAPRHMSVSRYSDAQLSDVTHNVDLRADDVIHVHIDAAHRGVGTASCGPDTLPEYLVRAGVHTWTWRLSRVR